MPSKFYWVFCGWIWNTLSIMSSLDHCLSSFPINMYGICIYFEITCCYYSHQKKVCDCKEKKSPLKNVLLWKTKQKNQLFCLTSPQNKMYSMLALKYSNLLQSIGIILFYAVASLRISLQSCYKAALSQIRNSKSLNDSLVIGFTSPSAGLLGDDIPSTL